VDSFEPHPNVVRSAANDANDRGLAELKYLTLAISDTVDDTPSILSNSGFSLRITDFHSADCSASDREPDPGDGG
jgi:hypothetical protein